MNTESKFPYQIDGDTRLLQLDGRTGIHPTSIHTRLTYTGEHTLNAPRGALTLWLMALEDLSTVPALHHIAEHQPDYRDYPLISADENPRNANQAPFALVWASNWYPQLYAKFFSGGGPYSEPYTKSRALVGAGHYHFHRHEWVQLGLTWDKPKRDLRIYINGVLIARSNVFAEFMNFEAVVGPLTLGNPCFAYGDLTFHEEIPEFPVIDAPRTPMLQKIYAGAEPETMPWEVPGREEWTLEMENPLADKQDLDAFYVQGCTEAVGIDGGTLLVETPMEGPDTGQVYLWTRKSFEGDLALEFDFMPCKSNGLSLMMLQASGMQREDFMNDYPLRTTGNMRMVYGENVRGYHWEFYREMDDTRNDVISNALIKAPWQRPLAYSCLEHPWELNTWYKVRFLQEGTRLRASINDRLVFDVQDEPFAYSGSHHHCGHFALRCMIKTKNRYRNLRVWNRKPPYTEIPTD